MNEMEMNYFVFFMEPFKDEVDMEYPLIKAHDNFLLYLQDIILQRVNDS